MKYFIGIDPNMSLIAVSVLSENEEVISWFTLVMQKKEHLGKASEWSNYIYEQLSQLFDDLEQLFINIQTKKDDVYIYIEMQRGRVMSIIETTLLNMAKNKGFSSTYIIAPKTWKSILPQYNNSIRGHYDHKKEAERLEINTLIDYCKKFNIPMPSDKRIHDLCDACLIARYGLLIYLSK